MVNKNLGTNKKPQESETNDELGTTEELTHKVYLRMRMIHDVCEKHELYHENACTHRDMRRSCLSNT